MTRSEPARYVGRFAPSPTGPLHFGSLLAAVASFLQASVKQGKWLLRVEDIDPPREQPGADRRIIDALEAYGFEWDGPVTYQSQFEERHKELVQRLLDDAQAYPCSCSRRDLAGARRGALGAIYPGTCRKGSRATEVAIRVRTDDEPIRFLDALQGKQSQRLESESGDFVIKRRDGLIAYHLAVVADDHDQGITEVVRGIDLLDSTPRHIHLQRLLGFASPGFLHIPVAENADGQKLSKLTGATEIDRIAVRPVLVRALAALGQRPARDLADASLDSIWQWAVEHWRPGVMTSQKSIPVDQSTMAEAKNPLS
ncbi:MAG: tRNA glutamyl-Q(34) synthetase GluQRS [Proteobacteria bacterium]|nr:tRNA glutamyl-Q(34) synthetase GluQRS [Pseudomonadota bacterium]